MGMYLVNHIATNINHCNYCVSLYQHTPLHIAAGNGYKRTTERLIEKGADFNIQDNDGVSIIHIFI